MEEEVKVAVLTQKVDDLKGVLIRLDDAIEKISEVNSNVSKILAVHEQRISKQEETDNILFAKIDKLRDKIDIDHNSMLSRIQQIEKRVWIVMGAIFALSMFTNNQSLFQKFLTPQLQSTIIERIEPRA
jgi:tetrahydromethanopterin S-methyltransferase subunit G